jgi:fluoride ion exporter CrcB/FEX
MGNLENLGRLLVFLGVALVFVGGLVWLAGRFFCDQALPGTVKIEFPGGSCLIPILASIVISILLTVGLNLLARWLGR